MIAPPNQLLVFFSPDCYKCKECFFLNTNEPGVNYFLAWSQIFKKKKNHIKSALSR